MPPKRAHKGPQPILPSHVIASLDEAVVGIAESDRPNDVTYVSDNARRQSPKYKGNHYPATTPMSSKPRVLHWFRTDLRIHDAPALHAGLALKPEAWYPVWCWDPEYVFSHRVGVNRFNFLIESMNDLSQSLTKLNDKSKLLVVRGSPYSILPKLFHDWRITHLVYEIDTGGYAQERDKRIREIARRCQVGIVDVLGHSLYHPAEILEKNGGKATTSITQWQKAASKLGSVPRPAPAPKKLVPPGDLHIGSLSREDHPVDREHDLNSKTRIGPVTCFDTLTGPRGDFAIPTLEELGYPTPSTTIRGGETVGRARLIAFNAEDEGNRAALFEKPQTSPAIPGPFGMSQSTGESKEPLDSGVQEEDESDSEEGPENVQIDVTKPSTTLMSPYLKFGCVGVRECYWSWHDILVNAPKSAKKPENLLGQLEFRDMYYAAELAVGGTNFARVQGNPICRYIPWNCPTVYSEDGNPVVPRPSDENHPRAEEWLAAWAEGRTGFPWIDALMRQLREEGWMHHLGRHSVACFLTRGQCYISWERGAEVFDGNAFFTQFFRVYGVATWPSKFDKTGALVRKYIPELQRYPNQYIYEPWLAPKSVQKEAGCIIGKDYPAPMLDEKEEKGRNIERMKAAYKAGLYGNDPKVLQGTVVIDVPTKIEDDDPSKIGAKRKSEKSGNNKARSTRTRKTSNDGQKGIDAYMKKK